LVGLASIPIVHLGQFASAFLLIATFSRNCDDIRGVAVAQRLIGCRDLEGRILERVAGKGVVR
jgi:hypothetical protein